MTERKSRRGIIGAIGDLFGEPDAESASTPCELTPDQLFDQFTDTVSGRSEWREGMKRHGKTPTHEAGETIQ